MRARAVAAILTAAVLVGGCRNGEPYVAPTPTPSSDPVQPTAAAETLRALQRALTHGDEAGAAELGAVPADGNALAAIARNVTTLGLRDVTFRYVAETGRVSPDGEWTAAVEATWRFAGFDQVAERAEISVGFTDAGAKVASVGGGDRLTPLWVRQEVRSQRMPNTLVLTTGPAAPLRRYTAEAQEAVAAVQDVLGGIDARLVVEVPDSIGALHEAVGAEPGTYDAVAAVTTAADGSDAPGSPLHVFLNPDVYGDLDPLEAQVVMTHEAVHVVTEAPFAQTAPLWLLEGFADYVALRDVDLPLSRTAGQIIEQVRADGVPSRLPDRVDFDTGGPHLGAAYEAAWLACVTLVGHGGEDALVQLYDAVVEGADLQSELRRRFGWTIADLTEAWQTRLADLAGASTVSGG